MSAGRRTDGDCQRSEERGDQEHESGRSSEPPDPDVDVPRTRRDRERGEQHRRQQRQLREQRSALLEHEPHPGDRVGEQ
jgi:hypothetical protein